MDRVGLISIIYHPLLKLPTPIIRLARAGLVVGWVAYGLIGLVLPIAWLVIFAGHLRDVLEVYVVSWAIRDGVDPSLTLDVLAQHYIGPLPYRVYAHPTPHPPTVAVLALPLTLLRYDIAEIVWLILQLLCVFASIHLLGRALNLSWNRSTSTLVAVGLIGWGPITEDLAFGNFNVMLLTCLIAVWLLLKRERLGWAGVVFGLSLLIKPLAWPIGVLLLLRGHWRTLFTAGSIVFVGYGFTLTLIGFEPLYRFITQGMRSTIQLYADVPMNQSLWSLFRRKIWNDEVYFVNPYLLPATSPELAPMILSVIVPLFALIVIAIMARGAHLDWSYSMFACLCIVGSPIAWYQYVMFAIIPIAVVVKNLKQEGFPILRTLIMALVIYLSTVSIDSWLQIAAAILGNLVRPITQPLPLPPLPTLIAFMPLVVIMLLTIVVIRERFQASIVAVDRVGRVG